MREKLIKKARIISKKNNIPFNLNRFNAALDQYIRQHGCLPKKLKVVDIKGIERDYLISLGVTECIQYAPPKNSRKYHDNSIYEHPTNAKLVTNPDGTLLTYLGKVRVENRGINKGWIVD